MNFLKDNRGQISAEMMIIIAIVTGLSAILLDVLSNNAVSFSGKIGNTTNDLMSNIDKVVNTTK